MRAGELQPDPELKPGRGQIVKVREDRFNCAYVIFTASYEGPIYYKLNLFICCFLGGCSMAETLDFNPQF